MELNVEDLRVFLYKDQIFPYKRWTELECKLRTLLHPWRNLGDFIWSKGSRHQKWRATYPKESKEEREARSLILREVSVFRQNLAVSRGWKAIVMNALGLDQFPLFLLDSTQETPDKSCIRLNPSLTKLNIIHVHPSHPTTFLLFLDLAEKTLQMLLESVLDTLFPTVLHSLIFDYVNTCVLWKERNVAAQLG